MHVDLKTVSQNVPISPNSGETKMSTQAFGNAHSNFKLMGREMGGGGTTTLPIGAIIGIAIAGSAVLFGGLTVMIMYYLRSRYKQTKRSRDLDLSEDNEEDIIDALRSTLPSDGGLVPKIPHELSSTRTNSISKDGSEHHSCGPQLDRSKVMPPAYAYEITGLRDSWPLVSWVQSQSTAPASKQPIINPPNSTKRTSYSAFPLPVDNEPSWPEPAVSRSSSYTRGNDGRPIPWSSHSAKSSITSLKRLSSTRKSISDNQLTSILRSTSQRLKEAQRRPLSRSMSVMSQMSGAPPTVQPASPPGDRRGESREALVETDDISVIDSVRSSLLNMISHTPSPRRTVVQAANTNGKQASPTTSVVSESDSLCPSKTPDLFIPAALSSPSRQGVRADQRYQMAISSTGGPQTIVHQADGRSSVAFGSNSMIANTASANQISSGNDPFISIDASNKPIFNSKSIKGPRPLIKQKILVEQDPSSQGRETVSSPLRAVSGNQKSPAKSKTAPTDLPDGTQENPFQWSPLCSPSLVLSPGQKPMGIKPKGYRRRRTVRLSHLHRPASVAVVLEEPEINSTPTPMDISNRIPAIQVLSPTELDSTSMNTNQSKISSTRPPSIPIFQPFISVQSTGEIPESTRSSDGSYSATMPFYNYYSSGGASQLGSLDIPEPSQSPTPSTKKSRRRGCNFSIDITKARDIALSEASTSYLPLDTPLSPPISPPAPFSSFDISNAAMAVPTFTSRFNEPNSPPPPAGKDSVTSSVSLLRRMNSEVSNYSTGSFLSDHSNGSPTIPALRGGGLSPTKRGSKGTMNYLNIGVKTLSPTVNRGRMRGSGIVGTSRDYHQSLILEDGLENYDALGLKMPVIEDLPPEPLNQSLINMSSPENWPPTSTYWPSPPRQEEAPVSQLRPMSTSMSQENCHSCNKPLSPLRLNPRDSTLASRYHDQCFKCSICNVPLGTAFAINRKPYCKQHYYEKVNDICNIDGSANGKIEQDHNDNRWSEIMTTPPKKSVRHESRLEMPSPHGGSPKSLIKWRGSLGLYDDMGFLRSSPDRGHDTSSFGSGPDNLVMGT